jgi:hypothetical protein
MRQHGLLEISDDSCESSIHKTGLRMKIENLRVLENFRFSVSQESVISVDIELFDF